MQTSFHVRAMYMYACIQSPCVIHVSDHRLNKYVVCVFLMPSGYVLPFVFYFFQICVHIYVYVSIYLHLDISVQRAINFTYIYINVLNSTLHMLYTLFAFYIKASSFLYSRRKKYYSSFTVMSTYQTKGLCLSRLLCENDISRIQCIHKKSVQQS